METRSERLVDVTQWIKRAAGGKLDPKCTELTAGLPVGQMIKRPDLRLLDAMNSIEMLDPRMDTGIRDPNRREFIFDPQVTLEPEEICWVMDELLALEVRLGVSSRSRLD